jgi:hypothetical protein
MRGLAKIHKPGDKMRPIISNINSAFQTLSTRLVNELRQLKPVTEMYVKNFTEFCQQLKDVTLQRNEVLVSFDVISLFPVAAAIEDMQRWFQEINLDVNKIFTISRKILSPKITVSNFGEHFYVLGSLR